MQWGPIWMVTNLSNPHLFFSPTRLCIAPPMDSLSLLPLSFLFFISPFPLFLPSATTAAADIPMNCGKVRVQGLQRIILIYAGAGPVAERACHPPPGLGACFTAPQRQGCGSSVHGWRNGLPLHLPFFILCGSKVYEISLKRLISFWKTCF